MKSILPILTGLFLFITDTYGQLTLTQSSYPGSVIGTDSLKITSAVSAFPSLPAVANGLWDMSTVTDSVPFYFDYRVPVAGYQYADSNDYKLDVYSYQGNVASNVTSTSILEYGINIQPVAYNLFSLTSYPNDSLIIDSQISVFSSPRIKVAFPATYNSAWVSSYSADLNFTLTFTFSGYTNVPCIIRRYTTEKDSVTGWGKMRVKDAMGSPSAYLNVLQVRTVITHTDSFFLNGLPMPGAILTMFNFVQGKKDTIYEQNYYRPLEVNALAQVLFKDAAYTQPYKAITHVQRLENVAVPEVANSGGVKIYPNPAIGRTVSVEIPAVGGGWSYELMNITGQKILSGSLNVVSNEIAVPASCAAGIYYLSIYNNGGLVTQKTVDVN